MLKIEELANKEASVQGFLLEWRFFSFHRMNTLTLSCACVSSGSGTPKAINIQLNVIHTKLLELTCIA